MSKITYASVSKHAAAHGLRLDTFYRGEEKFWLVATTNWQTTQPGRTLAEISAELDEIDGGSWQQKQDEIAAAKARQA